MEDLETLQKEEYTQLIKGKEHQLKKEFNEQLICKEWFWKQKSTEECVKTSDANTKIFHLSTLIR